MSSSECGPIWGKKYMEYALWELYCPVWDSLTGAHPGLFTSENKKALESYWYRPDNDASKKKERKNIYWIENKLLTLSYIKIIKSLIIILILIIMIIHNEANSSCLVYISMTNHSWLMNDTFYQELIQFILVIPFRNFL